MVQSFSDPAEERKHRYSMEVIERRISVEKERSTTILETDEIFRKMKMPVKGYEQLQTSKKYEKA